MSIESTTRTGRSKSSRFRTMVAVFVVVAVSSLGMDAALPTTSDSKSAAHAAAEIGPNDWFGTVNAYRAMSGLPPVGVNSAWDAGTRAHSCWMITNGIAHDEADGSPRWTPDGDAAGNASNVALAGADGTSPQDFIELWMGAPFHALGILRKRWTQTSYGECRETNSSGYKLAGASLDVIRGLDQGQAPKSTPTLFPGDGSTVRLYRFVAEYPNPVQLCGWSGAAGLPLIAMMPNGFSSASSTLTGPSGPIQTCTLHAGNTDGLASGLLEWDKAAVVMPRNELEDGHYSVSVQTNGGSVSWGFTVDKNAPVTAVSSSSGNQPTQPTRTDPPDIDMSDATEVATGTQMQPVGPIRKLDTRIGLGGGRLRAGQVARVKVAPVGVKAVSANVTAVTPSQSGVLTAFSCVGKVPTTSTVNFEPGRAIANYATVNLDSGDLCLMSSADTEAVIDVNGYLVQRPGEAVNDEGAYTPISPSRIIDTRNPGLVRLRPSQPIVVETGRFTPPGATAAAVNLTAVMPSAPGHLTAFPCAGSPGTSNLNYLRNETIANSAVVPLDGNRSFCLVSHSETDVVIDVVGHFSPESALRYSPLTPIRMFDSRSRQDGLNYETNGNRVGNTVKLKVAGMRGIPDNAKVVALNVIATDPVSATHLTAYPCDQKRPNTSNVNLQMDRRAAGNGALVLLSGSGEVCIATHAPSHIIVDVNGVWTQK